MNLNTEARGFDLASRSRAIRSASWAVFWLGESLWDEIQCLPDAAADKALMANTMARVVHGLRPTASSMPLLISAVLS